MITLILNLAVTSSMHAKSVEESQPQIRTTIKKTQETGQPQAPVPVAPTDFSGIAVAAGLTQGNTYAVAKRCGASTVSLGNFKNKLFNQVKSNPVIPFTKFVEEWKKGELEGGEFYEKNKSISNINKICSDVLKQINA